MPIIFLFFLVALQLDVIVAGEQNFEIKAPESKRIKCEQSDCIFADEILYLILSNLIVQAEDPKDLGQIFASFERVCKRFRKLLVEFSTSGKNGLAMEALVAFMDGFYGSLVADCKTQMGFELHPTLIKYDWKEYEHSLRSYYDIIMYLQSKAIDYTFERNKNALLHAAEKGKLSIIKKILMIKGININAREKQSDYTSLMLAAHWGNLDIVKELLKTKGVDVNAQTCDAFTALGVAIRNENINIIQELLQVPGINLDAKNIYGEKTAYCNFGPTSRIVTAEITKIFEARKAKNEQQ